MALHSHLLHMDARDGQRSGSLEARGVVLSLRHGAPGGGRVVGSLPPRPSALGAPSLAATS